MSPAVDAGTVFRSGRLDLMVSAPTDSRAQALAGCAYRVSDVDFRNVAIVLIGGARKTEASTRAETQAFDPARRPFLHAMRTNDAHALSQFLHKTLVVQFAV